jgi:hypothetical protein
MGRRRREWGVVVGRGHRSWGPLVECGGGPTSPLMGCGDGPSSPLVGSGGGPSPPFALPRCLACRCPACPRLCVPSSFRAVVLVCPRRCLVSSLRALVVFIDPLPLPSSTPIDFVSFVVAGLCRRFRVVWLLFVEKDGRRIHRRPSFHCHVTVEPGIQVSKL